MFSNSIIILEINILSKMSLLIVILVFKYVSRYLIQFLMSYALGFVLINLIFKVDNKRGTKDKVAISKHL